MTMVAALAEQHIAHIERQKRLGLHRPNLIRMDLVRPDPEPTRAAQAIIIPAAPGGRDWINVATPNLNPVSTKIVISVVAESYGITPMEIVSRRKYAVVATPRAVVCWILRNHTQLSLPQIGLRLGGRDHTTILHAARKIDVLRKREPEFAERIDDLVAVARARDDRWRAAA